jgi:CopG-like RHH_1 or ribbon-helix-helix domain, RHH_5
MWHDTKVGGGCLIDNCYLWQQAATCCYAGGMKPERTVVLSFRLPERLVKRVDTHAEKETRTRTNMVQVLLQEALDERDKEKK